MSNGRNRSVRDVMANHFATSGLDPVRPVSRVSSAVVGKVLKAVSRRTDSVQPARKRSRSKTGGTFPPLGRVGRP